jgi:hypothetical protein
MKLNKKFAETILVPLSNQGFYIDWDKVEKCEQIADEFAIEFAEWCDDNYFRMGNTSIWSDSTDWEDNIKITTKELLEIYKKEKEL